MPEFEDDERHDLFEVDELTVFHFFEEAADIGRVEISSFSDLVLVEGVVDEGSDGRVVEKKLHREEEGNFFAVGDLGGKEFFGEAAFDDFVTEAIVFEVRGNSKGLFDKAVIEEGQTHLQGVGHGIFFLPDHTPILQPFVPLQFEEAV